MAVKEPGIKTSISKPLNPANHISENQKITFEFLISHLYDAIDTLEGSLEPNEYRQPIVTLLFLKRLNDVFEEDAENLIRQGKSKEDAYENKRRHFFFIPINARWPVLASASENIGEIIDAVCRNIERENKDLEGVLTNTKYNDKKKYPDDKLRELISHFNSLTLNNHNLESEDVIGDAYEFILGEIADQTKRRGGQFFTPIEMISLLVNLLEPTEGMRICDPTCGSGGLLIGSKKYIEKNRGNPRDLVLEGQEDNYGAIALCKMNMVLHNIVDFKIEYGNILSNPRLVEGGKLKKYDKVLANFRFSLDWDSKQATTDPYERYRFGIPPSQGRADFAFIQHMFSSLNDTGQATIICPLGILFRENEESRIRENMIKEDVIEGVISLPSKLFYGTGIPGCILVLNKNKPPERKNKIIFIDASNDYKEEKARNLLREQDIEKIVSAFKKFKNIINYCHIADFEELKENEFNLNVPRYIDISLNSEISDIQQTIDEVSRIEKEVLELSIRVKRDLKELGFIVNM